MAQLTFESIRDLEHPGLKAYRTLRRRKDLERQKVFVAEGAKVVQRLLESEFPVESLLITEEWLARIDSLLSRRSDHIRVFVAARNQIEAITGFSCYQGIKAVGRIARSTSLEDVLHAASRPHLLVALDGISNAENLGVIVRNCAALGAQAVIAGETTGSPFLTRAIRTSMGAIFKLPAIEPESLVATLETLRRCGVRCIAAHPRAEARPLSAASLAEDCCLVFGSEGAGLSERVLEACDAAAAVPMTAGVDSLNVSSAVAVFLYEAARQRGRV